MPPRTGALVAERGGILGSMVSYVPSIDILAAKLVTLFPQNAGGPLPTHQAVILTFEAGSGEPACLLDGTAITAQRTAAASALATRLLARPDAAVLTIVGNGVQAREHARYVTRVRKFAEVRIAARDPAKAAHLAAQLASELGRSVRGFPTIAQAVRGADVVCTTTNAERPVLERAWLASGTHVNSVGTPGGELDLETIRDARVFVESRASAFEAGLAGARELSAALAAGALALDDVAEIGELLLGTRTGRANAEEITLYRSVGVAVEDAAAVALVLRAAREKGIGRKIDV